MKSEMTVCNQTTYRLSKRFCILGLGPFSKKTYVCIKCKKKEMEMIDALGVYNLPVPIWFQMPGDIFSSMSHFPYFPSEMGSPFLGDFSLIDDV